MNILVTGGLGVNGAWVIRELFERGHRPVVYESRLDTSLVSDLKDRLDIVTGDILDLPTVIRTIAEYQVTCVVHLAALMPGQARANPMMGFKINAGGTVNLLEACRITGVERMVFASSKAALSPATGEYGYPMYKPIDENFPTCPAGATLVYGTAKVASELMGLSYSEDHGIEFISLRFATIYGPNKSARHGTIAIHSKMIENAMVGESTLVPRGGDEKDDMLYVKDCAHAIVLACFAENVEHRIFHIGTGSAYSLGDLAKSIKKIYPEAHFDIEPGLDYMGMGGAYSVMDFSRAKAELGYSPQFDLDKGVRDYVQTLKDFDITPAYRP
jgi:UDP-glucose 4-epimerase